MQVFSSMEHDRHLDETSEHRDSEPTVMVSFFDDQLVICPPAQLDLEMTEVLVVAAASAVTSGETVMIDLDPHTACGELIARRPQTSAGATYFESEGGPVGIPAAGYVRLATRDGHWTIDLTHGRLFRSGAEIDLHFVGVRDWTQIDALWVTPIDVTALTAEGTYLSTRAAWTISDSRSRPQPA